MGYYSQPTNAVTRHAESYALCFVGRSAVGRYDLLLLVIYRGLVLCWISMVTLSWNLYLLSPDLREVG
jgi:hypothetical protein